MTTTATPTTHENDEFVPTPWNLARNRVGESIVKLAERTRMLGEKIEGARPETDAEAIRRTYDWGYKIGRDHALRTLVGDEAAQAVVKATWNEQAR